MKLRALFIAATVLLMPAAALAAPGIVTTTVSLKAGPGAGFPTVDRIPGGDRVNIHGCLKGTAWCDVSWSDDRGWVSSQYLEYLYRNRYVYLPDYVDEIDVPVVPFVLTSYWSSYYAGRPWYHRRAHWSGYWQSHERFATRLTIDRSAARIGRAAAARDAARPEAKAGAKARVGVEERSRARVEERTRAGVTERVTREKDIAPRNAREVRERAAVQPRMTRENARMTRESARENTRAAVREQPMARARTQTPPVMARGHDEPRAAAPRIERAAPHMTQPNAARGGPPMSARAQMPAPAAPRAAPAMPQGGGAPHINAAPRGGGGGPGGGGGHGQDRRQ
jgi:uncharacterized protein YraI